MNSLYLSPTSEQEIIGIIQLLKNKTSSLADQLSNKVMKQIVAIIANSISELINHSFTTGYFSTELKVGNIIPAYEGGDHKDPNNYRPITQLNVLAKIFEMAMSKRIENYLEQQNYFFGNNFSPS